MLSLAKEFKEKLADSYRTAPIDLASFHRHYKYCEIGECEGLCCNGGSGFYLPEEPETISKAVREKSGFFERNNMNLPGKLFDEEVDEETNEVELSTNTHAATYRDGLLPPHFPSTACIFKRNDNACSLQVLSVEEGRHRWWYKPVACWLYPIELEYGGKPHISVAHASTDEYIDDEYPGFVGFTPCGKECKKGGKPAYQVLEHEIAKLSELIGRDLMSEILAYKVSAA